MFSYLSLSVINSQLGELLLSLNPRLQPGVKQTLSSLGEAIYERIIYDDQIDRCIGALGYVISTFSLYPGLSINYDV